MLGVCQLGCPAGNIGCLQGDLVAVLGCDIKGVLGNAVLVFGEIGFLHNNVVFSQIVGEIIHTGGYIGSGQCYVECFSFVEAEEQVLKQGLQNRCLILNVDIGGNCGVNFNAAEGDSVGNFIALLQVDTLGVVAVAVDGNLITPYSVGQVVGVCNFIAFRSSDGDCTGIPTGIIDGIAGNSGLCRGLVIRNCQSQRFFCCNVLRIGFLLYLNYNRTNLAVGVGKGNLTVFIHRSADFIVTFNGICILAGTGQNRVNNKLMLCSAVNQCYITYVEFRGILLNGQGIGSGNLTITVIGCLSGNYPDGTGCKNGYFAGHRVNVCDFPGGSIGKCIADSTGTQTAASNIDKAVAIVIKGHCSRRFCFKGEVFLLGIFDINRCGNGRGCFIAGIAGFVYLNGNGATGF